VCLALTVLCEWVFRLSSLYELTAFSPTVLAVRRVPDAFSSERIDR
jgi:hypothetical protein